MKKWIPKILAYIIMIPILLIGIVISIVWNTFLLGGLIFKDIKRGYSKELNSIQKDDKKRIKEKKQKENS